jgi:ribonuclease D
MPDFRYVDPQSFAFLSDRLTSEPIVGLDTEFMRETTFYPELCLLQIATREQIFCADPMGVTERDREGFWRTLADRRWVVHSGRQDIEVLYLTAGLMPREIFDTQVAAALLGYAPQLGYAALVAELFGVALAKSHTRADWRRRPLSPEFIEYAAEDVLYLLPAYELLTERLSALGRLDWAHEDSSALLDGALYAPDPVLAVDRLKGARNLRGRARRAAESLAAWRETQAVRLNRPRQWILRDAALLEIAVAAPEDEAQLSRIPALPPKTARRAGKELLALVAAARAGADDYVPPPRPDEAGKALLKEMQQRVEDAAARLEVVPEVVAPRKELSEALAGGRNLRIFRGWRREVVGAELLELLAGC